MKEKIPKMLIISKLLSSRFNDYENSPYSTPPGCNGTIPAAAIAAR